MNEKIVIDGQYQHYRNKQIYKVIGFCRHSETYEDMVIYQALYKCEKFGVDQVWVRPKAMFLEEVVHEGKTLPRFERVSV